MIKVLHGDNILASRAELRKIIEEAKRENFEVIQLDGKDINFEKFEEVIECRLLFFEKKLIIIEKLFSLSQPKKIDKIINLISSKTDFEFIIWEDKELPKKIIKNYSNLNFELFKIPPLLFNFLNSLKEGQKKINLKNLSFCLKDEEAERLLLMLARQIRLLILAKEGDSFLNDLEEWQRKKIINQSKYFSSKKLKEIYKKILLIDYFQKTSQSAFDLSSSLDLLVCQI